LGVILGNVITDLLKFGESFWLEAKVPWSMPIPSQACFADHGVDGKSGRCRDWTGST